MRNFTFMFYVARCELHFKTKMYIFVVFQCEGANCPTTPVWSCNFDQGMCPQLQNLLVGGDAEFQWTRHQGQTLTPNTGPAVDHTQGTFNGKLC